MTIFTSILPPEQQKYEASWAKFSECTGITVKYEGSDQFEAQLPTRIQGGNAPDIAFIPQPGLLQKLVQQGGPVAAPQSVADNADKYWNPAWKAYGTVDGTFYGAPLSSNMKSLVWYSPSVFKDKGYTVPTTWDDMMKLSDKMVADGIKPWCGGIESGGATGWPATDWLEQVVLRQSGGDVYDKWVSHEILFDSPEIKAAFGVVDGWMRNPKYVNAGFGDVKTIATTAFQDAGKPILTGKCGMLQQASFYAAQWDSFKKGAKVAEDGDVFAFYLPQMSDSIPTPVVGGGEFVTAFSDRPEVQAFQTYLVEPDLREPEGRAGRMGLRQQRCRPEPVLRPDPAAVGGVPHQVRLHLPLRRIRPDARCGRCWCGVEADDGVLRREQEHRRRHCGDRRSVAGELTGPASESRALA